MHSVANRELKGHVTNPFSMPSGQVYSTYLLLYFTELRIDKKHNNKRDISDRIWIQKASDVVASPQTLLCTTHRTSQLPLHHPPHSIHNATAPTTITAATPSIAPPALPDASPLYGTTIPPVVFAVETALPVLTALTTLTLVSIAAVPVVVPDVAKSAPPTVAQTPLQCVNGGGQ